MSFSELQNSAVWKPTDVIEDKIYIDKNFSNLNLVGSQFAHVKLVRCMFDNCDFSHSVFDSCDIYDCTFKECVFYFCQLQQCELTKSRFDTSYLSGVRIRSCDLTRTLLGENFTIGVNRKLMNVPESGLPKEIFVCKQAGTIPSIRALETSYSGIAVPGSLWYIAFLDDNSPQRDLRRKSVLASHLANQLQAFGRGDSARYHYLARLFAANAEPKRLQRIMSCISDRLWGFGYHPAKLLWAGGIVNATAVLVYYLVTALGGGGLLDGGIAVSGLNIDSIGQYLYYCVVVATTLGFGDIVPYGYCRSVLVLQLLANIILVALWLSIITSPHREWAIPEELEN